MSAAGELPPDIEEARRLLKAGQHARAASLARARLLDTPKDGPPASRQVRKRCYQIAIEALFFGGQSGRLLRVFCDYMAERGFEPDQAFDSVYLDACKRTRTRPLPLERRERFRFLASCAAQVAGETGQSAECGCLLGLSSLLVCRVFRIASPSFDGTGHRIFDSFQGLSAPMPEDEAAGDWDGASNFRNSMKAGNFAVPLEVVQGNLGEFPGVAYFPGWIPQAFPADETRYRLVHVDVDLYQPTLDSIRYFFPRLLPHGLLVCDDYDYWPGARRAVEEYCAADNGVLVEKTPAGQALLRPRS